MSATRRWINGFTSRMGIFALSLISAIALAADLCVQNPLVTGAYTCMLLPRPADLTSPDYSFVDTMVASPDYPYAQVTTPPVCIDQPGQVTMWSERKYGTQVNETLERRFIFQRPKYSRQIKLPLIIWAHPNGGSDAIGDIVNTKLAVPALQNGFAFMSLEFRHPTASRPYAAPASAPPNQNEDGASPPPFCAYDSTDIAQAIQFASLHASQLMIDRENIFVVGQSRGSLTLLTGLMTDQKDPTKDETYDYRGHTSKPKAIFVAQAQVTYDLAQLRSTFIRPLATVGESQGEIVGGTYYPGILDPGKILQFPLCTNNGSPEKFDYHCHHAKSDIVINPRPGDARNALSALDALDVTDPPVWARYDRTPTSGSSVVPVAIAVADGGTDQTAIQDPADCYDHTSKRCLDVHHPNFGLALRQKYLSLSSPPNKKAYVYVQYAPTGADPVQMDLAGKNFYQNYWCFFIKYKRAGSSQWTMNITETAETRRMNAMQAYVDGYNPDNGDPPPTPPSTCGMTENDVWEWDRPPPP